MAEPRTLDRTFTATITSLESLGPDWIVVMLPGSVDYFGTGRAIKITGSVDGHPIATAFLPTGAGEHFLPMSAKVRKAIAKGVGDEVTVHLDQRLS